MLHLFAESVVDLEQQITQLGTNTVKIAALILIGCTIIAALLKNNYAKLKLPLFVIMAGTLVISTIVLFGGTIYLNTESESGGPVHWHSEIEFWACGTELELRDPTGRFSNKIGTATYHEHNDKHIHLEGVVVKKSEDASLEKFMRVTGGSIQNKALIVPVNQASNAQFANDEQTDGDHQDVSSEAIKDLAKFSKSSGDNSVMEFIDGQTCKGQPAEVQTFVYSYNKKDKTYSQRKLGNPANYVMSSESSLGPPSDCVIVEFDSPKDRTDKLCEQYGVKDKERCTQFGVKTYDPEFCNIREVTNTGDNN